MQESVIGPTRKRVELIDGIGTAFVAALRRIGRCFFLLHFASSKSSGIFGPRKVRRNRRIALRDWELIPPSGPPLVSDGRFDQ